MQVARSLCCHVRQVLFIAAQLLFITICHSALFIIDDKVLFLETGPLTLVCVCVCVSLYVNVCKVEWFVCIYSIFPRGDAQGYLTYVLHAIDLLEKTNVIAVNKPQHYLT